MRNYVKSTVAALLAIVILISTCLPAVAVGQGNQPKKYSKEYNSGERDVVCTTLDGTSASSYYTGQYTYANLSSQTTTQLFNSLRKLMRDTHNRLSTYNDCKNMSDQTDCENEDGRVLLIYTSYSATMSQWNGWNREHVWPQSKGGGNTSGGGADLHHIRPSDAVVNSTRGNKSYGYANGGSAVKGSNPATGCLGGYSSSSYFEPLDNVKGDIARIVLYVYVRWGSDWGADSVTEVFQSVDVLLEWCALDPVDTWEMGRNEVVEAYQGNRNVFIDYPELAWLIFGKEIPSDMTTPSGIAASQGGSNTPGGDNTDNNEQGGNTPGGDNTDNNEQGGNTPGGDNTDNNEQGGNTPGGDNTDNNEQGGNNDQPTVCAHSNTKLQGVVEATCVNGGYTGDKYCLDCEKIVSEGQQTSPTGKHSYSEWKQSDDGLTYVCSCTSCGEQQTMTIEYLIASLDSDAEKILILLTFGITDLELLDSVS